LKPAQAGLVKIGNDTNKEKIILNKSTNNSNTLSIDPLDIFQTLFFILLLVLNAMLLDNEYNHTV
jgi:hypothetical protein